MKRKIICSSLIALSSCVASAAEITVKNQGTLNIAPTFCELSTTGKIPSCTISIQASEGSQVGTAFYLRQPSSQYDDNLNVLSPDFSANPKNFTTNPLSAKYERDGTKQVRLIFTGKLTHEITTSEMYGRLIINVDKPGSSPFVFNLPVYFSTVATQKALITTATVGTTSSFKGKALSRPGTTLTVTNNGNGVFAMNGISFSKKTDQADYTYSDFTQLDGNVLPKSKDTILITDEKLAKKLQEAKGSTVILSSKRKTEYVEVAIGK